MSDMAVYMGIRKKLYELASLPTIHWPNADLTDLVVPAVLYSNGVTPEKTVVTLGGSQIIRYQPQISILESVGDYTALSDSVVEALIDAFGFNKPIYDVVSGSVIAKGRRDPAATAGRVDNKIWWRTEVYLDIRRELSRA